MYSLDALKFPELILFQLTLNTQRLPMKKHLVLQGKKKKKRKKQQQKTKQNTSKKKAGNKETQETSWLNVLIPGLLVCFCGNKHFKLK